MLVYNSIFDYYCCYDYAINCAKPSCINLEGLSKKTFCPTSNQFIGTFEYMLVIGLLTLVKLQITLTGQYMSPKPLTYLCNGILSNWYYTPQVLSCLYNYNLLLYCVPMVSVQVSIQLLLLLLSCILLHQGHGSCTKIKPL